MNVKKDIKYMCTCIKGKILLLMQKKFNGTLQIVLI